MRVIHSNKNWWEIADLSSDPGDSAVIPLVRGGEQADIAVLNCEFTSITSGGTPDWTWTPKGLMTRQTAKAAGIDLLPGKDDASPASSHTVSVIGATGTYNKSIMVVSLAGILFKLLVPFMLLESTSHGTITGGSARIGLELLST